MDVLSDVLATVRLQSTVLGRLERGGKWGLRLDRRPFSMFHLVLKGSCWLQAEGDDPREAHEGDVLLLPGGHAHPLRDAPGSPVEPYLAPWTLSGSPGIRIVRGNGGATWPNSWT